jgi:hypothetical protein
VETVPVDASMLAHAVVSLCLASAKRVPFLTNRYTNQDVLVFYVMQVGGEW